MTIKSYAEKLFDPGRDKKHFDNTFDLGVDLIEVFINHLAKHKYISNSAATCLRIKTMYDLVDELFPGSLSRVEKIQIISEEFGYPQKLIDRVIRRKITTKIRFPKSLNIE